MNDNVSEDVSDLIETLAEAGIEVHNITTEKLDEAVDLDEHMYGAPQENLTKVRDMVFYEFPLIPDAYKAYVTYNNGLGVVIGACDGFYSLAVVRQGDPHTLIETPVLKEVIVSSLNDIQVENLLEEIKELVL